MSTGDPSLEAAREKVTALVERFRANRDAHKSQTYNETLTRRDFIDPFFEALGWDMDNRKGYAPAYREVIHEDAIKIGGFTKAPDYCFRIGGERKFFVEAKKPFVDMKNASEPYFQLRRYAYSAKLPLSIVTDFEELAIVDCRAKPSLKDKASTGRIRYWRCEEYADHLEELLESFSPEGIKKGGLDRLAVSAKAKRGTGEVDKEFLREIETWRELLARNIARRNPGLTQRELNTAVQLTIDRIIFLRICEDRGIEEYGLLQGLQNGANVYARLRESFQRADERYNSGLFHFKQERGNASHPDTLTLDLAIDDKPLKQILKGLYYPDSPYEFSVLPIDILGQVYEQFLGKVIRLTAGHQAVIEDKPEVKKAGGVYYTPTYIVDYIVENTVGKLLDDKTPKQAEKLRILDPACGSGSFLIGAYEFLLSWHRDWYSENDAEKWAKGKEPRLFAGKNGWQLTTAEKKRILLNNIYGVDIDPQAVEVTKLSLLLKVLEEESQETINAQLNIFRERALPDLSNNIKCGNSLIGTDFYEGQQLGMLGEEELQRINPFDWEDEFAEIMKGGGFDAVIGNPPYRMLQPHNTEKSLLAYFKQQYLAAEFKIEIFHLFFQRCVSLLVQQGELGFIVPTTLLNNVYAESLRSWLIERCALERIAISQDKVFENADVHTSVIIMKKEKDSKKRVNQLILTTNKLNKNTAIDQCSYSKIAQKSFVNLPGGVWNILVNDENVSLIMRLSKKFVPLKEVGRINRGLITGDKAKYFSKQKNSDAFIPIIAGKDVKRYLTSTSSEFVLFERPKTAGGSWDPKVHLSPHKIVVRQIGLRPTASYVEIPLAVTGNIFTVIADSRAMELFILGIINSKLINFFWKTMFCDFKTTFPQITIFSLSQIPLPMVGKNHPTGKSRHDQMVELVDHMLQLNKQLQSAKTSHDKTTLQRQINATDGQIDRLVYELYDLADEDIKIVEDAR